MPLLHRNRDPNRFAVPLRPAAEREALLARLAGIEARRIAIIREADRAAQAAQSGEIDRAARETQSAAEPGEAPQAAGPEAVPKAEEPAYADPEAYREALDGCEIDRAKAVDEYFDLPRQDPEQSGRPASLFVEGGALVLGLSPHFVLRSRRPVAPSAFRRITLSRLRMSEVRTEAGDCEQRAPRKDVFAALVREFSLRRRARSLARGQERGFPNTVSLLPVAAGRVVGAYASLSALCVSGTDMAAVDGIPLPVRVEIAEPSHGDRPLRGRLNIALYSQVPEVRNRFSPRYNVSHAFLGASLIPSLNDAFAALGICSLSLNLLAGSDGAISPHLGNTAVHELLHTFLVPDQYRPHAKKAHPNVSDDDIMFTIGANARIFDYAFCRMLALETRVRKLWGKP